MRFATAKAFAGAGLAATLAGCAHASAANQMPVGQPHPEIAARALLEGYAVACVGVAPPSGPPPVRVTVTRDGRTVATAAARYSADRGRYVIRLAAGRYTVSAPRSDDPARTITIEPGQVRKLNFADHCK
jgi:hypothetical protein